MIRLSLIFSCDYYTSYMQIKGAKSVDLGARHGALPVILERKKLGKEGQCKSKGSPGYTVS